MEPNEQALKNREIALANIAAGRSQDEGTISTATLSTPQFNFTVPSAPSPTNGQPLIDSSLESLLSAFNQPTQAENTGNELQTRILKSLESLGGRTARQGQLDVDAGLPEQRKQLQSVVGQLQALQKEAAAIPLQIEQEFEGRGATLGGVAPIEHGRLRDNAIKALGLSAIGQTLQGNIALAESNIARAIDLEFEPVEQELNVLNQLYSFNKDALERADKKRADSLNIVLNERSRLLETEKINKQEIYNIGLAAKKFGAPNSVAEAIFKSASREEAVAKAGTYLQDPKAQIELQNARLDTILKQKEIEYKEKQTRLLGEPSEEESKATLAALKEAQASIPVMRDKITAVDVLKEHSGLNSRVGTSFLNRAPRGFFGGVGRALTVVGIPSLGVVDKATGAGQEFAGGVHKLTAGLTVQALQDAKARGATFGALSDSELSILSQSATALTDWEIKKDNVPTGFWNIDEVSFKRELETIKTLTQRALQQSEGTVLGEDEEAIFQAIDELKAFNPAF